MSRHAWDHPAPHRYLCRRCGLEKRHSAELEQGGAVWRVQFWRDGTCVAEGRTPPCSGPLAPAMTWRRLDRYCWASSEDYRICAASVTDRWRYVAWSPERTGYRSALRIHYPLGADLPQPRAWLGVFDDPSAARETCRNHQRIAVINVSI